MKEKFAVSLMCMDFLKVGEQLNILNDWVGMYHVDIMDGHYCKNITLSPDLVKSFKKGLQTSAGCTSDDDKSGRLD